MVTYDQDKNRKRWKRAHIFGAVSSVFALGAA
jgi:hypothetical protein